MATGPRVGQCIPRSNTSHEAVPRGALGIILPTINTRTDAEHLVHHANYAPVDKRSFGPTLAMMIYGADYVSKANDTVVTLAMVETAEALENVEAVEAALG